MHICYNQYVTITLTGENSFAAIQAERQIVQAFVKEHGPHGLERLDAESLTPERLPDLLQGVNLFAPARLVVIKNLAAAKVIHDPLLAALEHVADGITVAISDPLLDKRTKLYKFLQKNSTFKEFSVLTDAQLVAWLQGQAKQQGAELGTAEAKHLLARAGRDQWRLANEIEKLAICSVSISAQDIDRLVEPDPEGTAFDLLEAALAGKYTAISRGIAALKTKEDPYKIFGLIASQVHALAVVAAAGTRNSDAIAKDAGLHPFVVRKTQSAAKKLGQTRIARIAADVAGCDAALKSTGADPWDLLRLCLQKIARN